MTYLWIFRQVFSLNVLNPSSPQAPVFWYLKKPNIFISVLFKSIIITSNNNTRSHFCINRIKLSLKTRWRFTTIVCCSFFSFLHKSLFLLLALVTPWVLNWLKCTQKQCLFKWVLKLFFKNKKNFFKTIEARWFHFFYYQKMIFYQTIPLTEI